MSHANRPSFKKEDGTVISRKDIKAGDKIIIVHGSVEKKRTASVNIKTDDERKAIRDEFEATKASRMAAAKVRNEAAKGARKSARAASSKISRTEQHAAKSASRKAGLAKRAASKKP